MRIANPGIRRPGEPFTFSFAGREVEAWPGETIAAALLSAGESGLRETRSGTTRGVFCGMGVCGECALLVDGVQVRACLEYAGPGITVSRMPAVAPLSPAAAPEVEAATTEVFTPEVLVVGAGPAGLAAAQAAAQAGCDVLVVDERARAGGQYFKQPGDGFEVDGGQIDDQFAEGRSLIAAAEAAGARSLRAATVWGAYGDGAISVAMKGRSLSIRAKRVILSPGAYERPHAVPGWALPGVMTTGAAQTLLRAYQTAPGKRVLVAGNGPLNLQVARELLRAGVTVVALAEQAAAPGLGMWRDALTMVRNAPGLVRDGIGHLAALRRAGVSVHHGNVLVRAEGDTRVRRAVIARIGPDGRIVAGSETAFEVDAVCMGYGFLPQSEIARAMGCEHTVVPGQGGPQVVRDDEGRTSMPSVFVVGDAGGLGGARIAMAQGVLAGVAAARELGRTPPDDRASAARKALGRHRAFQQALWRVYAPLPLGDTLATPDTLICRCEEVDRQTIDTLIGGGLGSLGAIKRACRAGMGRCQGRYCSALIAEMLAGKGEAVPAGVYFAPRTPFKPVSVAALARTAPSEQPIAQ